MKIQSISFKNNVSGWSIDSLLLQNLSLFVGASGVGKTQILNAITTLKDIALGASRNGVEWEVRFEQESKSYVWVGAFASNNNDDVRFFEERKPSLNHPICTWLSIIVMYHVVHAIPPQVALSRMPHRKNAWE